MSAPQPRPDNPAYNGNRWNLHLLDDFSCMNFVYTMNTKSSTFDTVHNFAALVRNQYGLTVKVLRLDGESTLQNIFLDWNESNGIVNERLAPYCPQRNGAAERSSGIITLRSRSLATDTNIPEALWPETVRTATYLLSRSPSRQHNWEAPIEQLLAALKDSVVQRNREHLRAFGCRA